MTVETPTRPTYGNWIKHRSPGLWGAGLAGTGVLFAGILAALVTLLALGPIAAAVVTGLALLAFTAVGTPLGPWVHRQAVYARAVTKRQHQHRSGAMKPGKPATTRLPGHLANTQLLEGADTYGNTFAVVRDRGRGLYSIVARASADGPKMQDQEQVNTWVANYSLFLAACGSETGLVCAKAIADTAPDPGGRLGAMVRNLRSDAGPTLAAQVMDECVEMLPATSSENVTYFELTYKGRQISRKNDQAAILAELARKVPELLHTLEAAGGGSVQMVTPAELAAHTRVSYDPAIAPQLEQAEIDGAAETIPWDEAGPVASVDLMGQFLHDSARSITWEMYKAPTSSVTEVSLARLLAPHSDFARKRVALIYRPHTPDESADVAERDSNTANFVAQQSKKRPSASAKLVMRAAEQSRDEVAQGAASVRFSLMVTATVLDGADVDQAVSTLESTARGASIRLRRCYGTQAAAFATTLPVGFVPWEHTAISSNVREWL